MRLLVTYLGMFALVASGYIACAVMRDLTSVPPIGIFVSAMLAMIGGFMVVFSREREHKP